MPTGTSKNAIIWNKIKRRKTRLCIFFDQERYWEIDRNGEKGSHLAGIVKFRSLEMDDVNYKSLSSDIIR